MNYYPNIDKIRMIADSLKNDNSKSKLEYIVHTYLVEDYKCFNKSKDYWKTSNMIVNALTAKDFQKTIKGKNNNFIYSKIDQVVVNTLLQRSSETPKNEPIIDIINPDLLDDEPFRMVCE